MVILDIGYTFGDYLIDGV